MSLQTLKKKSEAVSHNRDHHSTFSINGGSKTLSYIGKTSRNSSVRTPFRGTMPVGFVTNATMSPVMAFPLVKAEIGATSAEAYQRSVRNTKSMISTKYKWVKGTYPSAVTQPTMNLTSSEHTQNVGVIPKFHEKNQREGRCTAQPIPTTDKPSCRPVINQPSSTHNIMQRLTGCSAGTNQTPTTTVGGFSDYINRLRARELVKTGEDKPFPFYMNNHCGTTINYTSAPEWYKNNTLLKCDNQ